MNQSEHEEQYDAPTLAELAAMTPGEKDAFLSRVRGEGRALTSEEQYAIFGPPSEEESQTTIALEVEAMEPAVLEQAELEQLEQDFFPELGDQRAPTPKMIQGIIFDFDDTLAHLTRPRDEVLAEGAHQAEAFMRASGMNDLPDDIAENIVKARIFAEEKSEEEKEEHIADDAMSFLLQFVGYPASKMDPTILRKAVEIFYAPEMMAWKLNPGVLEALKNLHTAGYKLAIIANYNCDRIFQRTIDYLGIRPYLDMSISSASVEYRKPDAKIFEIVLERWDALPYEVVVVGDSLTHDIQGGIELGAQTVLVTTATTPQVIFDNAQIIEQIAPDEWIDSLSPLPAVIDAWAEV